MPSVQNLKRNSKRNLKSLVKFKRNRTFMYFIIHFTFSELLTQKNLDLLPSCLSQRAINPKNLMTSWTNLAAWAFPINHHQQQLQAQLQLWCQIVKFTFQRKWGRLHLLPVAIQWPLPDLNLPKLSLLIPKGTKTERKNPEISPLCRRYYVAFVLFTNKLLLKVILTTRNEKLCSITFNFFPNFLQKWEVQTF